MIFEHPSHARHGARGWYYKGEWHQYSPCLLHVFSNLLFTPDLHREGFLAPRDLFAHVGMGSSNICIIFSGCSWVTSEIKWLAKWRNVGKRPGINQCRKECEVSYIYLGSIVLQLTQEGSRLQTSLLAEGREWDKLLACPTYGLSVLYVYSVCH